MVMAIIIENRIVVRIVEKCSDNVKYQLPTSLITMIDDQFK